MTISSKYALDSADRLLLNEIQKNAGQTNRDLSARVGLSEASCLRRIRRLKETGIIVREAAIIDPVKAGRVSLVVTTVKLRNESVSERSELFKIIGGIEWVTQCYLLTGEMDMLILSNIESLENYEEMILSPLSRISAIKEISTSIVYRSLNISPFIDFTEKKQRLDAGKP
ncbi:Lrp/AsnC family transcriptional regulator [Agrobacterium fabrum]|uniref:Lrp/AsnC family transcriptional regulator n=1 Tax=Agrobacterium fabrum TaxID=1176649 RepID=UPI003B9F6C8E